MNRQVWNDFTRTALSAAVVIVVAAPALAQNTTAAIGGRVVAGDGKPLAGVSVAILHTESKSVSNAVTDADGRYAARGLRVGGPYTITFSKDGKSEKREGVVLALAETLSLDAQLGTATVVVTGQAANSTFNRANMGSGTNIGGAQLNALASIQRNLQDYARIDPRISQTDKERGEISAMGQNSRYNSITIDGVTTSDTFGLESNGLPTLKQPITIDAIQSVQVNVSNYDVTQKGYTGANINAVTKSGTNEFKGSVYYVYRNDGLAGQRYNMATDTYFDAPKFKEETKGFTLGGPIIPDKLFFFASYEELMSTRNAPDYGPVGDAKSNVAITPGFMSSAAAIAKSSYGMNIGDFSIPSGSQVSVKDTLLKLDWTINDQHRANLRYTKTVQSEPIFPNISSSALSLNSDWYAQNKSIETVVGQWFADWSPSFSTEAKLSYRDYTSVPANNAQLPQVQLFLAGALPAGVPATTVANRSLYFGTERSRHDNALATKTTDGYFSGNWALGAHEVKAGVDFSRNEVFNAFLQDTFGNYSFRCVNSSAAYTYSFGAINCGGATAAQVEQAVLENFQKGRAFTYQAQVPAAGKTLADGAATWSLSSVGVFLQDTWKLNKQLTLMPGLRIDTQSTADKPLANAAAAAPTVAGNAATNTRQTGGFGLDNTVTLDGAQLVQPRLGFNLNLDPENQRRMQLRGGVGLFQGAAAAVWLSNPYSNTGVATRVVGCGGSFSACSPTGGVFNADPNNQPVIPGTTPAANVDFIEKGLGQPAVWKLNLGLDAELPWHGLVAGAEWLYTQNRQGLYYKHLNLGTVTKTGVDGREMYYNANGYNSDCWTSTGSTATGVGTCGGTVSAKSLSNSAFANVLQASQTKMGGGNAITLSLGQQPSRSFGWSAAYTRTSAKEVSPLTSSVSNSNWAARSVLNPNEEVAANSAYLIQDRVSASVNWSKAFIGRYKTTMGLFYEGRKGKPYSWTYNNDLNGDGYAGNDLMYIPKAPGSGEVVFAGGSADEARFWEFVNANSELKATRGGVVKRNSSFAPFVNSFDLRLSQEVPGFSTKHAGVFTLDFLNVGNMISRRWGRIDEVGFQSGGGGARSFVNYKGMTPDGKYIYSTMPAVESLATRQAKGESQWAVQATVRYEF